MCCFSMGNIEHRTLPLSGVFSHIFLIMISAHSCRFRFFKQLTTLSLPQLKSFIFMNKLWTICWQEANVKHVNIKWHRIIRSTIHNKSVATSIQWKSSIEKKEKCDIFRIKSSPNTNQFSIIFHFVIRCFYGLSVE